MLKSRTKSAFFSVKKIFIIDINLHILTLDVCYYTPILLKGGNKVNYDYEINSETLAILPIDGKKCLVLQSMDEETVVGTPKKIIEKSCEYFGSSYEGRVKGTVSILGGGTHKVPIVICDYCDIIFFPTLSPDRKECIWLSYQNILSFTQNEDNDTVIQFKNGKKLIIPISILSLSNQYLRSSRLATVLSNRKIQK